MLQITQYMKLFLTLLLLAGMACHTHAIGRLSSSDLVDCDTLFTVEGKTYIAHIIRQDAAETQFSLCDDPSQKVYVIQTHRITRVAKEKIEHKVQIAIPEIQANPAEKVSKLKPLKSKTSRQKRTQTTEEVASGAFWQGILSIVLTVSLIFMPVAIIVGAFAIKKGKKAINMAKGHPKDRKIRRRGRWGVILGGLSMGLSLGFLLWLLIRLSNLNWI